jgi:hypothetical protein
MAGLEISRTILSSSSREKRDELANWLKTAVFTPIEVIYKEAKMNGILRCEDPQRSVKLEPLLTAMVTRIL